MGLEPGSPAQKMGKLFITQNKAEQKIKNTNII